MKRAILALLLLACSAVSAQAQRLDPLANLKNYAARILPRCPGGVLTMEKAPGGPAGFDAYVVTVRSDDKYCGTQKMLLHSPKSKQVFVGVVVPLPEDARPTSVRLTEHATKLLGHKVNAVVSAFPLPDGVRSVDILRETPHGPFSYAGFLDASQKFLIVGSRGTLGSDPSRAMLDALGTDKAARRGSGKAQIIELSDFQCPTCASAHKKIEPIIQKNLGKIEYIRIDLPLFEHHQWAVDAAMGARAIQRVAPAKYWEYVDHVFASQESLTGKNFDEFLKNYAEDRDLDWAAIRKVYSSKAEREALMSQVSRAFAVGIMSTPTFIVNGQVMGFGPDGAFTIQAIQDAIARSSAAR